MGDVLRALGQNPTEGDVKKLVQSNTTGVKTDGRVTFETFLPLLQAVSGKKITDTVDDFVEGLRHFDKEGNGRISAIELRHLLTGLGEKMSEEEVGMIIPCLILLVLILASMLSISHNFPPRPPQLSPPSAPPQVEQLIHGKEDSQGNINYEEFVKMVLAQ